MIKLIWIIGGLITYAIGVISVMLILKAASDADDILLGDQQYYD